MMQLANNELDGNYFQHMPFLNAYNATVSEENQLVAAIPVHYEPYGIYAGKTKTLEELADGATITITNDPSNETRALFLLQDAGLITLPEDADVETSSLTVLDIVDNPKNLNILEVEANTLPATLEDADLAVINGNFAIAAGLSPATDAIFLEPSDSESGKIFTNYVVFVRKTRKLNGSPRWLPACKATRSRNTCSTARSTLAGVIPAF